MEQINSKSINPQSSEPLYEQIRRSILDFIEINDLQPGSILPSERELSEVFSVSRLTIRKAIEELIRLGVVFSRPGKGTFIGQPKIQQRLLVVTNFTDAILKLGHIPGAKILEKEIIKASGKICQKMGVTEGTPLLHMRRLRFVDEIPFSIQSIYLNCELLPGIDQLVEKSSLYSLIEEKYGIKLSKTKAILEAVVADYTCASLLWVKPNTPLFIMSGAVSDSQGRVIELFKCLYRGDRMRFETESS
jgi:GntR family transcriptional regulator